MSMLRRRSLSVITAFVLLIAPHMSLAQTPPAPVIAIIDMQRIMRESEAVTALQLEIDSLRSAYQERLLEQEAAVREAEAQLSQERGQLTPEQFAAERTKLEGEVATLQRQVVEDRQKLDSAFAEGMREIQVTVIDIADAVATGKGANILLGKSSVLLSDPGFEITDEVLQQLNIALPRVSLPDVDLTAKSGAD